MLANIGAKVNREGIGRCFGLKARRINARNVSLLADHVLFPPSGGPRRTAIGTAVPAIQQTERLSGGEKWLLTLGQPQSNCGLLRCRYSCIVPNLCCV